MFSNVDIVSLMFSGDSCSGNRFAVKFSAFCTDVCSNFDSCLLLSSSWYALTISAIDFTTSEGVAICVKNSV